MFQYLPAPLVSNILTGGALSISSLSYLCNHNKQGRDEIDTHPCGIWPSYTPRCQVSNGCWHFAYVQCKTVFYGIQNRVASIKTGHYERPIWRMPFIPIFGAQNCLSHLDYDFHFSACLPSELGLYCNLHVFYCNLISRPIFDVVIAKGAYMELGNAIFVEINIGPLRLGPILRPLSIVPIYGQFKLILAFTEGYKARTGKNLRIIYVFQMV